MVWESEGGSVMDIEPMDTPESPPLAVYCPVCGAYLMTLWLAGPYECELCGAEFPVEAAR